MPPGDTRAGRSAKMHPMASQRFTCIEDGASKFWEVAVEGATLTVRYGKLPFEHTPG